METGYGECRKLKKTENSQKKTSDAVRFYFVWCSDYGCDGEFDVDDDIASFRRSSFCDLVDDPDVSSEDLYAILDFYKLNKRSLHTPICWDCALFRVLGYTMKYGDKRNGRR